MFKDLHFWFAFISIVIFIISLYCLRKNKKNIFLTIRSIALFYISNFSIIIQIIIICCFQFLNHQFNIENNDKNIIINLYFIFHFITFFSIAFKYCRLILVTKINEDLTDRFYLNNLQIKNLYYGYLYNRIIIFILIILGIIYYPIKDKTYISPFLFVLKYQSDDIKNFKWSILFFIENIIIITLWFKINFSEIKIELKIQSEIFFYLIINLLYNFSLLLVYISEKKNFDFMNIIDFDFMNIILIYLILIYINQILFPIFYAILNKTIIIYGPVKSIAKELYLFLTDRKCCDYFMSYLNNQQERKKNNYFLSLYINILDYRLRCIINDDLNGVKNKGKYIIKNFLEYSNNEENDFIDQYFLSKLRTTCISFLERNICKINMFDEILITCYNYLNYQFSNFKSSNEYINLISAINYQTYLRCKFIQCGLMVKE